MKRGKTYAHRHVAHSSWHIPPPIHNTYICKFTSKSLLFTFEMCQEFNAIGNTVLQMKPGLNITNRSILLKNKSKKMACRQSCQNYKLPQLLKLARNTAYHKLLYPYMF